MITTLTKRQEQMIKDYQQLGLKIGRDTSPIDKEKIRKVFTKFYSLLGKPVPALWWAQSPFSAMVIINLLQQSNNISDNIWNDISNNIGNNIWNNISNNIGNNIWNNIWNNIKNNIKNNIWTNIENTIKNNISANIGNNIWTDIGNNIRNNIGSNIKNNIWTDIGNNIWNNISNNISNNIRNNIWNNIWSNIWNNIENNIGNNIRNNIENNIWTDIGNNIWTDIGSNIKYIDTYCWGQYDIGWILFYKYFKDSALLPNDTNFEIFDSWYELAEAGSWCFTFDNVVFACEKPQKLFLNSSGQLHKDGAMALEYSDGWGIFSLNGVAVPEWLATQKDTEIDPKELLNIKNADIRREFVRKVGYDRIFYKLGGTILDEKEIAISNGREMFNHKYTVAKLNGTNWTVLKMINPSLSTSDNEVYHVEGLPPECDTVEKAINFRKPEKMKAIKIDNVSGEDYYQHGDRILWPVGATSLKMYPKILT